jgi:hypothetical protein
LQLHPPLSSSTDSSSQLHPTLPTPRLDPRLNRPISGSSEATTHDSHLSSILDPAMIVTPVTLVRTASGRQAAVQRVALRGQEKARVVRLPPSAAHPHGPSPLSLPTTDSLQSTTAAAAGRIAGTNNVRETFGFSPPGTGLLGKSRGSLSGQSSFSFDESRRSTAAATAAAGLRHSLDPFSDLSAMEGTAVHRRCEGTTEEISSPSYDRRSMAKGSAAPLQRSRSAAYSIASSSFGGSSVCDSFIEDEEVEFPTVLGRSAATLAQRILQQQHEQQQQQQQQQQQHQQQRLQQQPGDLPLLPTSTHHHVNLRALGRDRAISLSSIITEEARRSSVVEAAAAASHSSPSVPGLPGLPTLPMATSSSSLATPQRPFAGGSKGGRRGSVRGQEAEQQQQQQQQQQQLARLSSVSSLRSGYGSVLEGIPFTIGLSAHTDDLFGPRPLSFDAPNGFSDSDHPPIDHDIDQYIPEPYIPEPHSSSDISIVPAPRPLARSAPAPAPASSTRNSSANNTATLLLDPETRAALDYINQLCFSPPPPYLLLLIYTSLSLSDSRLFSLFLFLARASVTPCRVRVLTSLQPHPS